MALLLAIRLSADNVLLALVLVLLAALLVLVLVDTVRARGLVAEQPHTVKGVSDASDQIPAFLLTYLFPFVALTVQTPQDGVAYAAFGVLLILVLVRTDLFLVNPVLLVVNFRLYRWSSTSGAEGYLLARRKPVPGQVIMIVPIADGASKLKTIVE